jgi:uncharacterized protein
MMGSLALGQPQQAAERIKVARCAGAAIVTITGDALGLFGVDMLDPFDQAIRALDADPDIRCIVLTGAHPGRFISHADVAWLKAEGAAIPPLGRVVASGVMHMARIASGTRLGRALVRHTPLHGAVQLHRLHEVLSFMQQSGVLYIAALNGSALGLGAEIAWACDLRVMPDRDDAFIGHPEVLLGFAPGAGGTQRLSRLLGEHKTLVAMLEGRPFPAQEALKLGIIDAVVPAGTEVSAAIALSERFAGRQRWAISSIKQTVYLGGSETLPQGLFRERREFAAALPQAASQSLMQDYLARTARHGELPLYQPKAYDQALKLGKFTDDERPQSAEAGGQVSEFTREDIAFTSGQDTCKGWFYKPHGPTPAPLLVMGHGIGATREMGLDAYARRFAQAGIAVLAFTYRNFGDSGGAPRQLISIASQEQDWHAAIDHGKKLPGVDASKVSIWGSSFGGGHVITIASQRRDLTSAVAQCPFTEGRASASALGVLANLKLAPNVLIDMLAAIGLGKGRMVAIAAEPGKPALMSAHDALPGYQLITPTGVTFVNQTPARVIPSLIAHSPGRRARDIRIPTLFCVCEHDTVAPSDVTLKHVRQAPLGTVRTYRAGHFEFYVGKAFEQLVADQSGFLIDTLFEHRRKAVSP